MTDTDFELHAEFRALETELVLLVAPPGIDTARGTARRRRAVRRAVLAVASVLPLVAGVLLAVGWHHPAQRTGAGATPQFGPVLDRREVGYCPPPDAQAPDGAVTPDEVCNGTVDVPAWPSRYAGCPSGPVTFTYGAFDTDGPLPAGIVPTPLNVALHYMRADVLVTVGEPSTQLYHDTMPVAFTSGLGGGAVDTIVQVNCEFSNAVPTASMVLALRRGLRGSIETVGSVVAGQGPSIKCLYGLGASGDEVRVLVGDACNWGDHRVAELQWRSYRLVEGVFIQSGGPTSFGFNRANVDYVLSVPDVVLTHHGDRAVGELAVTITNWQDNLPALDVDITFPKTITIDSLTAGCTLSDQPTSSWVQVECVNDAMLGVGTGITFDLRLSTPAGGSDAHGEAWIRWAEPALQAGLVGSQQQAGFEISHSR